MPEPCACCKGQGLSTIQQLRSLKKWRSIWLSRFGIKGCGETDVTPTDWSMKTTCQAQQPEMKLQILAHSHRTGLQCSFALVCREWWEVSEILGESGKAAMNPVSKDLASVVNPLARSLYSIPHPHPRWAQVMSEVVWAREDDREVWASERKPPRLPAVLALSRPWQPDHHPVNNFWINSAQTQNRWGVPGAFAHCLPRL